MAGVDPLNSKIIPKKVSREILKLYTIQRFLEVGFFTRLNKIIIIVLAIPQIQTETN
jgi:hypothetical protein